MNRIVFETANPADFRAWVKKGVPLFWLKGFHAFHHKGKLRFFPPSCPGFVEAQIKKGAVGIIDSTSFNVADIYIRAGELAVDNIETVWPQYLTKNRGVITCLTKLVKSDLASHAFKKDLCEKLGEFFSVSLVLNRVSSLFPQDKICFYSAYDASCYHEMLALLQKADIRVDQPLNIKLLGVDTMLGRIATLAQRYLKAVSKIIFLVACSTLKIMLSRPLKRAGQFSCAINVNTSRQLRNNARGPLFFLEAPITEKTNPVLISTIKLDDQQKKHLNELPGAHFLSEEYRKYLFASFSWLVVLPRLLFGFLKRPAEYEILLNVLGQYIKWKKILKHVSFKKFISHCDFSIGHIGRNIALREKEIETFYFTDSMNSNCNFLGFVDEKTPMRHPFWTYLTYDHFITWTQFLDLYFTSHPGSGMKAHVVGCIWSSHVKDRESAIREISISLPKKMFGYKMLGVFDTTYTQNGFTSYQEGIQFAKDIFSLVLENENIFIIFKTKKDDQNHVLFDPELGPILLSLYSEMDKHPRICFFSNQDSASNIIACSDLVISFPFTSTTFEALSANIKAIWHDPLGLYQNTPYGKLPGITTKGYLQLKECVTKIVLGQEMLQSVNNSSLMDPFRDGKAIDRFREIILSA